MKEIVPGGEGFYILPIKELNKNNDDFKYNTEGSAPQSTIVKIVRSKNFFEAYETNPIHILSRFKYKWKTGVVTNLKFQTTELRENKPVNRFETNPWKEFFAFGNALFRDFYWEGISVGETVRNRDVETEEEILLRQPRQVGGEFEEELERLLIEESLNKGGENES